MRVQVQRLEALTGLRFVAAAAVVAVHIDGLKLSRPFGLRQEFVGELPLGGVAVTFFFVLSGFILAHVYPVIESPAAAGRFLLARVARLWPAHLAGLALAALLDGRLFWQPAEPTFDALASLGLHLAMLQSWVPARGMIYQYNVPSWSISTEFTFYLLFIPLARNWERSWRWKLALALATPLGLVAAVNYLDWPATVPPGRASYEIALYFNPLFRVWQFALGMAAAVVWRRPGLVQGRPRPRGPVRGRGAGAVRRHHLVRRRHFPRRGGHKLARPAGAVLPVLQRRAGRAAVRGPDPRGGRGAGAAGAPRRHPPGGVPRRDQLRRLRPALGAPDLLRRAPPGVRHRAGLAGVRGLPGPASGRGVVAVRVRGAARAAVPRGAVARARPTPPPEPPRRRRPPRRHASPRGAGRAARRAGRLPLRQPRSDRAADKVCPPPPRAGCASATTTCCTGRRRTG